MNKENFKSLISAIENTGKFRFNMYSYISDLTQEDIDSFSDDFEFLSLSQLEEDGKFDNKFLASIYEPYGIGDNTQTNIFNCNSVACIAGYATAIVNNWKTPNWLNPNSPEYYRNVKLVSPSTERARTSFSTHFENTSNEFLGLTPSQGEKLYYNRGDSLWKFLRFYESERYPSLQWEWEKDRWDIDYYYSEVEEEKERCSRLSWTDDELDIDYGTINYITVTDALTRILNGEIVLGDDFGDIKIVPQKEKEK